MITNQLSLGKNLIIVEVKVIGKQMCYLILNGSKKQWVRLWEATEPQTQAILRYERDRNHGVEPIYHPGADENIQQFRRQLGKQPIEFNNIIKYNLRQRELLQISKNDFYGIAKTEQKQNQVEIDKKKQQIKKQENRKGRRKRKFKQEQVYDSDCQIDQKKKGKGGKVSKSKIQIIEVESINLNKKKFIKKFQKSSTVVKKEKSTRNKLIEILDSDSEIL